MLTGFPTKTNKVCLQDIRIMNLSLDTITIWAFLQGRAGNVSSLQNIRGPFMAPLKDITGTPCGGSCFMEWLFIYKELEIMTRGTFGPIQSLLIFAMGDAAVFFCERHGFSRACFRRIVKRGEDGMASILNSSGYIGRSGRQRFCEKKFHNCAGMV